MNDILKKIDEMRLARGWSVNNLAMEAMLTQSTINNLYMRETEPKLSTLRAICAAFGITLAEFFADEDFQSEDRERALDSEINKRLATLSISKKEAVLGILRELGE